MVWVYTDAFGRRRQWVWVCWCNYKLYPYVCDGFGGDALDKIVGSDDACPSCNGCVRCTQVPYGYVPMESV